MAYQKSKKRRDYEEFNILEFPYYAIVKNNLFDAKLAQPYRKWIEENCEDMAIYDRFRNKESIIWFQDKSEYNMFLMYFIFTGKEVITDMD